ncbi:Na(+)/dicarboxylate cotransporter 3-like isoform X2 [Amblyomma americanum]
MIDQFANPDDLSLTDLARHGLPERFQTIGFYVRVFAMYAIPVCLTPLLRQRSSESHCAFIVLYVLFLWLFQSFPPAIVSFLPIILAPPFLGFSSGELLAYYTSETMLLYIGYALVVQGVEATNLHKRLILTFLLVFGGKSGFIIGGFVITTILVSMWTNAVRTAAIVLPIAMEALQHIQDNRLFHVLELRTRYIRRTAGIGTPIMEARYLIEGGVVIPDVIRILSEFFTVKKGLLIGISYSAVLGSMGSVVGCGGNLFVKAFMEQMYNYRRITIYQWVQCHLPLTVLCSFLLWFVLSVCYASDVVSSDHISKRAFEDIIYRHFAELGAVTYTEVATIITFLCMAAAIVGSHHYAEALEVEVAESIFNETACVFFSAFVLHAVPSIYHQRRGREHGRRRFRGHTAHHAVKKISWAFIITMGAGVCVAKLIVRYNLQQFFDWMLPHHAIKSAFHLQLLVTFLALVLAEINNSLNNIVIFAPLICHMSDELKVHPMYLLMPFTFCCYFGFMTSTATPVSEYVTDYGDLLEEEFILPGIAMKIGCALIVLLAYNTWCWDYLYLKEPVPPLTKQNQTVSEKFS